MKIDYWSPTGQQC